MAKSSLTDLFNMNESQFDHGANGDDVSKPYRKGSSSSTKRGIGGGLTEVTAERVVLNSSCPSPCGACKFLRRKCISGCIFAPYFGSDQGAAKFAAVHKVFGASNVSKLLLHIPTNRRHDAIVTISYEAQARLSDPVYGCVSTILALQQQVASLQAELEMVQTQLMNSRFAVANAFQGSQTVPQHHINVAMQPAYSNTSSSISNNNLMNIGSFVGAGGFQISGETTISNSFHHEPIHQIPSTAGVAQEEEDEEESHNIIPVSFTSQIFD